MCTKYLVRLNVLSIGDHVDLPAEVGDGPSKVMVDIVLFVCKVKRLSTSSSQWCLLVTSVTPTGGLNGRFLHQLLLHLWTRSQCRVS